MLLEMKNTGLVNRRLYTMKIGIITFHWGANYGAVIQAYALQKYITSLGHTVEIIDYKPLKTELIQFIQNCLSRDFDKIKKGKMISDFVKENLLLSKKTYRTSKSLLKCKDDYDVIFCGSDQVWNESFLFHSESQPNPSYYLSFAGNNTKRCAYAVSFGTEKLQEKTKRVVLDEIKKFSNISVRENTGLDILNDLGFSAQLVSDPTLLLNALDYSKLLDEKNYKTQKEFFYILHSNQETAKKVCNYIDNTIELCPCISEYEWLHKIKNSEIVITNSFHGIVFSIIFNTPFVAITVEGSGMNDRIYTLLERAGLSDRIVSEFNKEKIDEIIKAPINWQDVNNNLRDFVTDSKKYIDNCLSENVFDKKKSCCGCGACYNVCPKNCIEMLEDSEGFLYPQINKDLCINCGLCKKVCPFMGENTSNKVVESYACNHNDSEIRKNSSSGGVFSAICEKVIENNGVVFGAGYGEDFSVAHKMIENADEIQQLRGSKYVQSFIGDCYTQCKEQLDLNKQVVFSGTPCQILGLKKYLRKDYENLICVEIICHGVPSPKLWDMHLDNLKKQYNSAISRVSFRDKKISWREFMLSVDFKNGQTYAQKTSQDAYLKGFLSNLYLRPSCHNCKARGYTSNADIILGDFWGVWKYKEYETLYDNKGTTAVLVMSQKGKELFDEIKSCMDVLHAAETDITDNNTPVFKSTAPHPKRDKFFSKVNTTNFNQLVSEYTKVSTAKRVKAKIKSIIRRLVK